MSKRKSFTCPWCGLDVSLNVDDDYDDDNPYPIYCPRCDELLNINDECYCSDCKWNNVGHCLIPEDDKVTLGEDCPYRGE